MNLGSYYPGCVKGGHFMKIDIFFYICSCVFVKFDSCIYKSEFVVCHYIILFTGLMTEYPELLTTERNTVEEVSEHCRFYT